MVIILVGDLYPTELLPKGTGGQACRGMHKNMFENVISVKDLPPIFISQVGF